MKVINYLIVITLIIIGLFLKTGGFSISGWNALSFNHIDKPLAIFLLLWAIRLIKVRRSAPLGREDKSTPSSIPPLVPTGGEGEREGLSIGGACLPARQGDRWGSIFRDHKVPGRILLWIYLLWLGMKINNFSINFFPLYLPHQESVFHPALIFTFSAFLVGGIAFLIYLLAGNLLGELTAIFAAGIFLLSPLSRINTSQLFPGQIIVIFSLGSLIFFTEYLGRYKRGAAGSGKFLGVSIGLLALALLMKWVLLGMNLELEGFRSWILFQSRLKLALPVVWHYLLWAAGGMILFIFKRRMLLVLLFLITLLWTFFVAKNSTLDVYMPLICLLSIMIASCLVWMLQNKFTNRTIFDRNLSFAIVVTFFILSYFSTVSKFVNTPRRSGYEAEKSHHLTKSVSVVDDKNASSGRTVLMKRTKRKEKSLVMYGPYDLLLPGDYETSFRLLVEDNALRVPVINIDVATDGGDSLLAWRDIRGSDFEKNNSYETFPLKFSLNGLTRVEYRVCSYGYTDMRVDRISIRQLSQD